MLFHQFLVLVACLYACYYLMLICIDSLRLGRVKSDATKVSEYVVAPETKAVRVVSNNGQYQLASDQKVEKKEADMDSAVTGIEHKSTTLQAHDLGLEIISSSGGMPVSSAKFRDWVKCAS